MARLKWGKDRELDSMRSEHLKGWRVCGGFGEPHSFRFAAESALEVPNAPNDLRLLVAFIRERQNHVVVGLCHGRAMPGELLPALFVRLDNRIMDPRRFVLHPGEK